MKHLISVLIFLPLLGAMAQTLRGGRPWARWIAILSSAFSGLCGMALVGALYMGGESAGLGLSHPWMSSYSISYDVAIEGTNALLVLLISIVFPLLILSEWTRENARRGLHALLLVLQTAVLGTICAQDLFLLLFFWVLVSLPAYFLVGIWGDHGRESAGFRQVVVSMLGNTFFFMAVLLVYYSLEPHTFSLAALSGGKIAGKTMPFFGGDLNIESAALLLMSVGLALRAPIWPLHGWFTGVAKAVPSTVLVALAVTGVPVASGIFLKLSYSLFPDMVPHVMNAIVIVGILNVAFGTLSLLSQKDLRSIMAYLSLVFAGLILIGTGTADAAGLVGACVLQFAFGLSVAGLGFVADFLFRRGGSYSTASGGGLIARIPHVGVISALLIASLVGMPGALGFVGTSLLYIGSYSAHPWAVIAMAFFLLLIIAFLFQAFRDLFLGERSDGRAGLEDLGLREGGYMIPIVIVIIAFGFYPAPLIDTVRPAVLALLAMVRA